MQVTYLKTTVFVQVCSEGAKEGGLRELASCPLFGGFQGACISDVHDVSEMILKTAGEEVVAKCDFV